jgi:endonuclease YncB( thermonuclease family)
MNIRKTDLVYILGLSMILISCSLFKYDISINVSKQNDKSVTAIVPTQKSPIFYDFECIASPENPEIGYETEVIDGDSIKAKINGKEYEIRYIGVNTPEYYSNERIAAEKAAQENKKMVEGKKLYLFKDKSNTDKFKRLLRYVFTEDYFVNYELVKRNLAESKPYLPDVACQALFDQAAK